MRHLGSTFWRPHTAALAGVLLLLVGCSQTYAPQLPWSYRFDDRLEQALSVHAPPATHADVGRVVLFSEKKPLAWHPGDPASQCEVKGGALHFTTQREDAITSPGQLGIDGPATDSIAIRMRVSGPDKVKLSWRPRGADWSELHRVTWIHVPLQDVDFTYNVQVSGVKAWRHRVIDQLRLTAPFAAKIEIRSIQVLMRQALFAAEPVGLREYSIDNRVRPCLFAHCPARIEYRVRIPERARFAAGLGAVHPGPPVTFRVEVTNGDDTAEVLSEVVDGDAGWREVDADLSKYANAEVKVVLKAECDGEDQIALWSNPALLQATSGARPRRWRRTPVESPNVLIYVVDALPAKHLDAYGYHRQTAPNLTALAERGVRFERCFSQETWTKPSMASLATGVDTFVHGIEGYGDLVPKPLDMLPEVLRKAGYATCAITENPHTPPDAGGRRAYSYLEVPHLRVEIGEKKLRWNQLPDVTYDAASAFLERHKDNRFFLYIHTMECHDVPKDPPVDHLVYEPPDEYRRLWAASDDARNVDVYDCTIPYADRNFRRVLDKLEALGLKRNTLVIFTADHGEAFGEHEGHTGHYWKPYNELIHIPLVMYWPGVLPAGKVVNVNVQMIDLTATVLDFAGLPPNPQFQGMSLRSIIEARNVNAFRERTVFSYWWHTFSAVNGDWKLFYDAAANRKMLFNIAQDPGETRDVAQENPEPFAALDAQMSAYVATQRQVGEEIRAGDDDAAIHIDPNTIDILESLGYLDGDAKGKPNDDRKK